MKKRSNRSEIKDRKIEEKAEEVKARVRILGLKGYTRKLWKTI